MQQEHSEEISVGIIGASGYSGIEATRLLAAHPGVTLRFLTSDRWAGQAVSSHLPDVPSDAGALRYVSNAEGEKAAADCDAVLLATPAETSLELTPRLLERSVRVVNLSGAFRIRDASLYPRYYGFTHTAPTLLAEAVYGLPALNRESARKARLIANPGCYATAVAMAFLPLLQKGLLEAGPLIADAASGVTGAGRKATEDMSFTEVADDFRAYKTLQHQHTPEIQQALSSVSTAMASTVSRPLTFTPHLLPLRRGILATCYARVTSGTDVAAVMSALQSFAAEDPFFRPAETVDAVSLRNVVGTNDIRVGATVDTQNEPGRIVIASALDNLLKGAAGQAVQNLNLMFGMDETLGLNRLRPFSP